MLDFLTQNKEWLFSGLGVAVLGGIYGLVRWWVKKRVEKLPQVIIHVSNSSRPGEADQHEKNLMPTTIERVSRITFEDIRKAIDNALPLQRDQVAKSFAGIKIEMDTYLSSAHIVEGDIVRLTLTPDKEYRGKDIFCEVHLAEYRELGVLPEGTKIRIQGEIKETGRSTITLNNVKLYFHDRE